MTEVRFEKTYNGKPLAGRLYNWYKSGHILVGILEEDLKGRFPNNAPIRTSEYVSFFNAEGGKLFVETLHSIYELDVELEFNHNIGTKHD